MRNAQKFFVIHISFFSLLKVAQ